MSRIRICAVALAGSLLISTLCLAGQQSSQRLASALAEIRAGRLDTAISLLQPITNSPDADSSLRAEAFLWLGVATFYKGQDSAASTAFRNALGINPFMAAAVILAKVDSGLAELWEAEQTHALCGEFLPAWLWPVRPSTTCQPLNASARGVAIPEIVSGPQMLYPNYLRRVGVQGRVVVRVIVDTLGHAERGSAQILWTVHRDFNRTVIDYVTGARYRVATSKGVPVRSCVVLPVDFRIRR